MSYDIELIVPAAPCPTCGHDPRGGTLAIADPTSNLSALFTHAFGHSAWDGSSDKWHGLHPFSGKTAAETLSLMKAAIARLRDPYLKPDFDALEKRNMGWGTTADAIWVLEKMVEAASKHPDGVWRIST